MSLNKYRDKRDFTRTPEPPGLKQGDKDSLQFVVHKHRASRLHWDLRLELDGVLKSWAIPKGPSMDARARRLAVMVEDHPFDYKYFEGLIPEGNYGAGSVMIWDRGSYNSRQSGERGPSEGFLRTGLEKGHITFVLQGERLRGEFALVRLKRGTENNWLLIKKNDEFAEKDDVLRFDTSVSTGRTMNEITKEGGAAPPSVDLSDAPMAEMPAYLDPMLATLVREPFSREGWIFEIKWDGYRCLSFVKENKITLYSRTGKILNEMFPPIVRFLGSVNFDAIFDGEIVVTDEKGRANFQLLQNYRKSGKGDLVYYVFDVLYSSGHDLRNLPLLRRKEILGQILPKVPSIRISDHIKEDGKGLFKAALDSEVEGIMAKDGMSPYRAGTRGLEWLKIKTRQQQETVIAGFTAPKGGRKGLGSLILGVYDGKSDLIHVGNAGTGLMERQLTSLHRRLMPLVVPESPFKNPYHGIVPATWVRPDLVSETRFAEWTSDGKMRHPVFVGIRDDVDPRGVHREESLSIDDGSGRAAREGRSLPSSSRLTRPVAMSDHKVEFSNTNKIFWPEEGYTKGDVIEYYRAVAPFILPYIVNRPESLHRHPDGIMGESFFQKNVDHHVPSWVTTVKIQSEPGNKETVYLVCQSVACLLYVVNLGCIEINPWHSTLDKLDSPDFMVLDFDPLEISFAAVVEAAQVTREILTEAGAWGFCKTSGATGLHIYVPLKPGYTSDQSTQFARLINILVQSRLPNSTSVERSPEKRKGKVYLDYLQNRKGQTLVAPYSIRPIRGAPVSTPLFWHELKDDLDPRNFTMENTISRLAEHGDLWKEVLGPGVDMTESLARMAI
jgi:bifunctional non-homologous end joining protein LigD